MTPRALRILGEVAVIAAEDTRHTRKLLTHFDIKTQTVSCHKFNEEKRADYFMNLLENGKDIALVSDAGTPCISDPGYKIVDMAHAAGFTIVPVCGASAVVAALSASGFDISSFGFVGFLPRNKSGITKSLSKFLPGTVVFYESPQRITGTLQTIAESFPHAQVCLCNDISKKFERIYRSNIIDVIAQLDQNENTKRGEYACVLSTEDSPENDIDTAHVLSIEAQLVDIMQRDGGCTIKDAISMLSSANKDISKKEIYAAGLRLKGMFEVH